jgi:NDP-sugar pyrophosphorylase family protein
MISQPILLLAGGLGTRLSSVLGGVPKPLAPVGKRPFLDILFEELVRQGATRVILSLHTGAEHFVKFVKATPWSQKLQIDQVIEPELMGTGGAARFVIQQLHLKGGVMVANADTYIPDGFAELAQGAKEDGVGLVRVPDVSRYGTVEFDSAQRVTAFREKLPDPKPGWIYSGISIFQAQEIVKHEAAKFSIERDFFPAWIARKNVLAVQLSGDFIDIGIPEDYQRFCDRYGP